MEARLVTGKLKFSLLRSRSLDRENIYRWNCRNASEQIDRIEINETKIRNGNASANQLAAEVEERGLISPTIAHTVTFVLLHFKRILAFAIQISVCTTAETKKEINFRERA